MLRDNMKDNKRGCRWNDLKRMKVKKEKRE
jgi:hypothetical protein